MGGESVELKLSLEDDSPRQNYEFARPILGYGENVDVKRVVDSLRGEYQDFLEQLR